MRPRAARIVRISESCLSVGEGGSADDPADLSDREAAMA